MAKNRDFSKFPNAITVLDNGNVGIGNTNPGTTLHISTTNGIRLQYPGNTGYTQFSTDGTNAYIFSGYDGERMRITSTGDVIIGATSANSISKLSVRTDASNAIAIESISPAGNKSIYIAPVDSGIHLISSNYISSGPYLPLAISSRENNADLYLGIDGKIGIGTSSPAFKFDVSEAGSVINGTATIGSNMKGIRIYNSVTATNNSAVGLWFSTGPHQAGIASFRATADTTWETSIAFYTHIDTTSNLTDATEKMRISGQGYVTKPSQPSFYATSTAGQTDYASGEVVVFNTTRHNTGSHYNTSNGRFTAPVSGKYLFSLNLYAYGGYRFSVTLTVNGNQYAIQDLSPLAYHETTVGEMTTGYTIIWELSTGDYVEVRTRVGYTSRIYRAHSHFSGQLLS